MNLLINKEREMLSRFCRVVAGVALLATGLRTAHADGQIVAIGDEWLLTDFAFGRPDGQAAQLATNIASVFASSPGARFAVFADGGGFHAFGASLRSHMLQSGHQWDTSPGAFSLATLLQYDGVFLAGPQGSGAANADVLAEYVRLGGNVLVMAGVGFSLEAASWNPFLHRFGIGFDFDYFGGSPGPLQVPTNPTTHPIGNSLQSVVWDLGLSVIDLDPLDARNEVAVFGDFTGLARPPLVSVASHPIIATFNIPPRCMAPEAATNPESMTVCVTAAASFTAGFSGSRASLQWRKNGTPIVGATSGTLRIEAVTSSDAGTYDCIATNACGSATSAAATLTVRSPLIITPPTDQAVNVDQPVLFVVEVDSAAPCSGVLTFQWQRRNPLVTDSNSPNAWISLREGSGIVGTTSPTLVLLRPTPGLATGFRCMITGGCGCEFLDTTVHYTNTVNFTVACPADFNADGGIDFGDVEAFFERWENGC